MKNWYDPSDTTLTTETLLRNLRNEIEQTNKLAREGINTISEIRKESQNDTNTENENQINTIISEINGSYLEAIKLQVKIISAMADENNQIRKAAWDTFIQIANKKAFDFLWWNLLNNYEDDARWECAFIFKSLKDPRSAIPLLNTYGDVCSDVTSTAFETLLEMADPEVLNVLHGTANSDNMGLQEFAKAVLNRKSEKQQINEKR